MASSPNSKTLSLCFLFYVLLLFMHGSSARDMKEQEEVPKRKIDMWAQDSFVSKEHAHDHNNGRDRKEQEEVPKQKPEFWAQHSLDSKEDQPYITAYGGNSKRVNQPYITSYGNSKRVNNQPYITGYINKKRVNQPYITGYINQKRVDQLPYITGYGNSKDSKVSSQDSKESYAATYTKNPKDSYAATYAKNPKDSYAATYAKSSEDSYAATYKKEAQDHTNGGSYKVDHTEAFKVGFFTLDDLYVGNRMTLRFPIKEFPHFVSKKEADAIPFSMSQLPSVLQLFSVSEDSSQAQAMRDTLEQCEIEPLTGETKTCVSSLESMIDFVRGIIGSESQLDILTTTLPTTSSVSLQNHTVLEISQDIYAPKWVACHPLPYPYAVFYCHFIGTGSKIFKVQLGTENGENFEALGICHLDTSEWSPDHILFQQLGIKPGEAPLCHFFPVKHLVWVPLPSKAAM